MNRFTENLSRFRYGVLFVCCFLCCVLNIFPVWKSIIWRPNQILFAVCIAAIMLAYTFIIDKKNPFSEREIVFLIFAVGFAFRLAYVSATDFYVRQHDLEVGYPTGHYAYMLRFLNGDGLPEVNVKNSWQFYQPPAWHFLCGMLLKIQRFLGISELAAFENLQNVTLFCSSSIMLISHRLFKMFGLKKAPLYFACGIVAFHPTLIILSGSLNNDILSITLSLLSVVLALKWYRSPSFKAIILLALSVGISMAVKLSAGLVSLGIAMLFLIKLFSGKHKKKGILIGQFSVFGIICVPLALWWQVRNFVLFKVPLTFVPKLSENNPQYIGFRTVTERLFDFSSLSDSVYPVRAIKSQAFDYFEYNIPLGALKSSVFGEYYLGQKWPLVSFFAHILFWTAVVIALLACIGAVYMLVKAVKDKKTLDFAPSELIFTIVCSLTLVLSYVKFCFDFAHFCTMDFRYITLTIVFAALYIGLLVKYAFKNNKIFGSLLLYTTATAVILFAISSVAVYATIA